MIASSVKLIGFSCFKQSLAGFDQFTPITVVIGRNNTGKSRLLDVAEALTADCLSKAKRDLRCKGTMDEEFLTIPFSKTTSGGELGPSYSSFYEEYSNWNATGKHYLDMTAEWKFDSSGRASDLVVPQPQKVEPRYRKAAELAILQHLRSVKCPLSGGSFRRMFADRDVLPEISTTDLTLEPNGRGATNIIRRFITSSALPEDLIQVELLKGLNSIFGSDGEFLRIEIREHDRGKTSSESLWEVFLGEEGKGQVALGSSGSGLKTVFLVLLNLLVVPAIDKRNKDQYVFGFEELENNLHPALLRRLFAYVCDYVQRENCHVFLTTHSSVALDYFGPREDAQIIRVTHDGESAHTKTISAHFDRLDLLSELGAKPSDILQSNGVVWVEGPSDRIYMNRFIDLYSEGRLREGRDYQCAYYGGALLAKSQFSDPATSSEEFANLLRLNSNVAVVCDGDRTGEAGEGSRIKSRVQRIKKEVEAIPNAFLWITDAKEIENYVPGTVWAKVYEVPRART
jgi:putative ATP-dependent endonuclease of the OLD family